MGTCEHATIDDLYDKLQYIQKEVEEIKSLLLPEVELSKGELDELNRMRKEAKKELKEGKLILL